MKLFLALAFVAAAHAQLSHTEVYAKFVKFTVDHGKEYSSPDEFATRMAIFQDNLERVQATNAILTAKGEDAVHGITKFMDLTPEEFKATYLMADYQPIERTSEVVFGLESGADVDWRTKGAVTAVKDQGQCGSCWAFSAVAAIESYAFLATGRLTKRSTQQVNSCDKRDGGCNGGNTETAYQYVVSAGGVERDSDYPYTSGHGQTGSCKFNSNNPLQSITGYRSVARGESNLASALNNGPASICLAADAFQTYSHGVLSSCPGRIDHCVQAVGQTSTYWLIRNSWGTGWGESGYIRVKKGSNLCQVSDDVTYPTF